MNLISDYGDSDSEDDSSNNKKRKLELEEDDHIPQKKITKPPSSHKSMALIFPILTSLLISSL